MITTASGYKYGNVSDIDIKGDVVPVQELNGNFTKNPLSAEDIAFLTEFLNRVGAYGIPYKVPKDLDIYLLQDIVNGFANLKIGRLDTGVNQRAMISGGFINIDSTVDYGIKVYETSSGTRPSRDQVLADIYSNTNFARRCEKFKYGIQDMLDVDIIRSAYADLHLFKRMSNERDIVSQEYPMTVIDVNYLAKNNADSSNPKTEQRSLTQMDVTDFREETRAVDLNVPLVPYYEKSFWSGGWIDWMWNHEISTSWTRLSLARVVFFAKYYNLIFEWEVEVSIGGNTHTYSVYQAKYYHNSESYVIDFIGDNAAHLSSDYCKEIIRSASGIDPDSIIPSKDADPTVLSCKLTNIWGIDACLKDGFVDAPLQFPEVESLGWSYDLQAVRN